jgi:hypothetical protein
MHEGRIRTTTRHPVVRLLYVGMALVLRNLWVWLHYAVLSKPRRGGRIILLERLRWETLWLFRCKVRGPGFSWPLARLPSEVILWGGIRINSSAPAGQAPWPA